MNLPPAGVRSPCINVCRIDQASGLCAGCWRTLDEIAGWSAFPDAIRRAVLARVEQRRAAGGAGEVAVPREGER